MQTIEFIFISGKNDPLEAYEKLIGQVMESECNAYDVVPTALEKFDILTSMTQYWFRVIGRTV